MDVEKLVFIDETWTSTNMTRRRDGISATMVIAERTKVVTCQWL